MKRKILISIISLCLVFTLMPIMGVGDAHAYTNPSNPKLAKGSYSWQGIVTWDCIYFGNYYQSSESTKDPIKWRVLSVNGDDAFILADTVLDTKEYGEPTDNLTWETSPIRRWLNSDFMNTAFTSAEKSAILTSSVKHSNNPYYGTSGGNDTMDKVFILSTDELTNLNYGFDPDMWNSSLTRKSAAVTNVLKDRVMYENWDKGIFPFFWVRTPGEERMFPVICGSSGGLSVGGFQRCDSEFGVRPAMHINLASSSWSNAGTVSEEMEIDPVTSATLSTTTYTYSGSVKTPTVTVKGSYGNKLVKDTDYTVSYSTGRKSVGTYKVTVKGKGIHIGTITKSFKINPAKPTQYTPAKAYKAFTAKWKKSTSANASGYQVRYSTSSKMTSPKTVTVSGYGTTSKKISKLKSKKKYYIQVRCYKTVNGTKYYSAWSASKYVTTR